MAFNENVLEHARYVDGVFTYYAEITCDTQEDIPSPAEHPNWEAGSKLYVLEGGGSCYRLSNSREWKPVNFDNIGEGGENGLDPENFYTMQQVDVLVGNVQNDVTTNAENIADLQYNTKNMIRTLNAATEEQVRQALQFAAENPGCYLSITLAANLNVTIPSIYLRNATVSITGQQVNGVNSNTITFEQTSSTSNLHLQNTALSLQNLNMLGNHNHTAASYGVIRMAFGSTLYCSGVVFGQAEESLNFGNNIEVRGCSRAHVVSTTFRTNSPAANAACMYLFGNAEAVTKDCTIAEDSVVQNIARLETGSHYNQIGTDYGVYMIAGHASIYCHNGIQRVPVDMSTMSVSDAVPVNSNE
ncbi:MAG: hypothetical protein E7502_03250 [Ruminococcus sp.]|nr:hypothetical protein [Ruminococcus sp.]